VADILVCENNTADWLADKSNEQGEWHIAVDLIVLSSESASVWCHILGAPLRPTHVVLGAGKRTSITPRVCLAGICTSSSN
jgi:hypothetical protein